MFLAQMARSNVDKNAVTQLLFVESRCAASQLLVVAERATLGHTMVRNWPQPLQNLFMLRLPGWIYYAEEF